MRDRGSMERVLTFLIGAAIVVALSMVLDGGAYHFVRRPDVYDHDGGRLLRIMGFYPTWMAIAAAAWLEDRGSPRPASRAYSRSFLLFLSPGLGGLAAEGLKILLRRERPALHDGAYVFRSWTDHPFFTGNLGLPSSHAMVAFAGAAMAARIWPRSAPVWYLLATGCALTRVLVSAHFLSDVVVAAVGGWVVAWLLWRRFAIAVTLPPA